jgi:hypothetical protein
MREMFATAQRGKHAIIFFGVRVVVLSITARVLVRYVMRKSGRSRKSKKA